jgi:phosphinothricin acetyltransferase
MMNGETRRDIREPALVGGPSHGGEIIGVELTCRGSSLSSFILVIHPSYSRIMLRPATPSDAAAIVAIYNHYIMNTVVTFEEEAIDAAEMSGRMAEVTGNKLPWLVWEENHKVLGYAYASKWKSRCSYRYSVETTIYLDRTATGFGLGTKLYSALIADLKKTKIHAIIGGVALPNAASVGLHEKLGFEKIAQFIEVGWKFDQWIDVGYWELVIGKD